MFVSYQTGCLFAGFTLQWLLDSKREEGSPSVGTCPIAQWSFEKRAFSSFHLHKTLQPFDRLTIVLLQIRGLRKWHVSLRSLVPLSNKDSSLVRIIQTHNKIFLSSARQSSFSGFAQLWDDPQKGRKPGILVFQVLHCVVHVWPGLKVEEPHK